MTDFIPTAAEAKMMREWVELSDRGKTIPRRLKTQLADMFRRMLKWEKRQEGD